MCAVADTNVGTSTAAIGKHAQCLASRGCNRGMTDQGLLYHGKGRAMSPQHAFPSDSVPRTEAKDCPEVHLSFAPAPRQLVGGDKHCLLT